MVICGDLWIKQVGDGDDVWFPPSGISVTKFKSEMREPAPRWRNYAWSLQVYICPHISNIWVSADKFLHTLTARTPDFEIFARI